MMLSADDNHARDSHKPIHTQAPSPTALSHRLRLRCQASSRSATITADSAHSNAATLSVCSPMFHHLPLYIDVLPDARKYFQTVSCAEY